MLATLLGTESSVRAISALADMAIKGVLLLSVAGVASAMLRRYGAAVRHLVWSLALAGLVVLPVLSLALPKLQVAILPTWAEPVISSPAPSPVDRTRTTPFEPPSAAAASVEKPPIQKGETAVGVSAPPHTSPPSAASLPLNPELQASSAGTPVASAMPKSPSVHWTACVLLVWLGGMVLAAVPFITGTLIAWWRSRQAVPVDDGRWLTLLSKLKESLSIRRPVTLLRGSNSDIPFTWGVRRPVIMLPAESDDWSDERRRAVLLHELAHVKRVDCLTQFVAHLALVLHWFNPLAWLAGRIVRIERERACDDLVLSAGLKPSDYAGHLLDIVRTLRSSRCPSLAAVAMARKSQFEGRMRAILDPSRSRRRLTRLGIALAIISVVSVVLPISVLQAIGAADAAAPSVSAPQTATPPATAAAEVEIVADPAAALKGALPQGLVIQKEEAGAAPFYLEPGKGRAFYIGKPLSAIDPANVKGGYTMVVWLMPADYAGRDTSTDPHRQTGVPPLAAAARNGKVYVWPGSRDEIDLVRRALLVGATAPSTQPAIAAVASTESPTKTVERFLELIKANDPRAADLMAMDFDPQCRRFVAWRSVGDRGDVMVEEFKRLRTSGLRDLDPEVKKCWADATTGPYPWVMTTGDRAVVWLSVALDRQLLLKRQVGRWQIVGVCSLNMACLEWQVDSAATATQGGWGELLVVSKTKEELDKQALYLDLDTGRTFAPPTGGVTEDWIVKNGIDVGLGAYDGHYVPPVGTVGYGLCMEGIFSYWLATPAVARVLVAESRPGAGKFGGGPFAVRTREGKVGLLVVWDTGLKFIPVADGGRAKALPELGVYDTARLFLHLASYPGLDETHETLLRRLVAPGLGAERARKTATDIEWRSQPMAYQQMIVDKDAAMGLTYPEVTTAVNTPGGPVDRQAKAFIVLLSRHGTAWLVDDVRKVRNQEIDETVKKFQTEHPQASEGWPAIEPPTPNATVQGSEAR